MSITTTEPFLGLSPFIFGDPKYNNQGMIGITSLNFMCNVDSQASRLFSMVNPGRTSTVGIKLGHTNISEIDTLSGKNSNTVMQNRNAFANTNVLCKFLTLQDTDVVDARNCVPYMDFPRYLTTKLQATSVKDPSLINLTDSYQVVSQNMQLNQIPDYFIINVRKPMVSQTITDSSTFMGISNVNISLNNSQGLLGNSTQVDLWRMSVKNGSSQSWQEFSGLACTDSKITYMEQSGSLVPFEVINSMPSTIFTSGSLLVINPALDLSLPIYLSNGSIGSYNFQIQMNIYNNSLEVFSPEIIIITANSGTFTTQSGSSMIQSGLLTKEIVINTTTSQRSDPVTVSSYARTVGGSYLDGILTNVKHIPIFKNRLKGSGVASAGSMKKMMNDNLNKFC